MTPGSPNEGYGFDKWLVMSPNGLSIVKNSFIMPSENVKIKAIYNAIDYNVTITTDRNSQKLKEPHRNSQKLTETHRKSQKLTETDRNSQKLTETHRN